MISIKKNCYLNYHYMTSLSDYWSLKKSDKAVALRAGIDYLFRFSNTTQFKNNLINLDLNKKEVLQCQRKITCKAVLTKDIKIFLMQKTLGMKPLDVGESKKLYSILSDKQLNNIEALAKKAILSKSELDKLILNSLEACKPYVAKFVRKKMTFLIKTGRHPFNEMCNQFLLDGLQALLFMYPRFESELHAINILKRSIKNIGENYIETHTRMKRNDYSDSHTLRTGSIFVPDSNLLVSDIDSLHTEDSNLVSQLEVDVADLLNKFSDNNLGAILLLMGNYDKGFTEYLNSNNICKCSNDLYSDNANPQKYNSYVFKYLNISVDEGEKLIKKLRKYLSAHTNFNQETKLKYG